jgi:hypothetical protein
MRILQIESDSEDLILGFLAGIEWVNDSAVFVLRLSCPGEKPGVLLLDQDGEGADGTLRLTEHGLDEASPS